MSGEYVFSICVVVLEGEKFNMFFLYSRLIRLSIYYC